MTNLDYKREGSEWVFTDGTRLKVVSGGADSLDLPTLGDLSESELSEFTRGVLAEIDEVDRPIVQKYLSTWDKKVQSEFTARAERLKPWEQLGSIEDVQQALEWIGTMNEDPVEFYNKYTQALKDNNMFPNDDDKSSLPEFEGLPQEFVDEFRSTKSELAEMKKWRENFQAETEQEKLVREVDSLMKNLHSEHGDFDEEWVLLQMQKGIDPVESVKKFKTDVVEKYSSSARKPAPVIMPSNGAVPSSQVDFSKMTSREKQEYMVKRLQDANAAARG